MRYGFVLPYGDARAAADLAELSERCGWDGFFVYEPVWGIDAWVSLAAAAMTTSRIRLGTLLSPISRMRPWKVASETATLDHLSGGRVILAVGLGALDTGFAAFGEVTDTRTRAALMDEGLDIVTGLWRGQPFGYDGEHYRIRETDFLVPPGPLQTPRIPVWVVGLLSSPKSMARVMRYDGLLPSVRDEHGAFRELIPEDLEALAPRLAAKRDTGPFDVVVEGVTAGDRPADDKAILRRWQEAGATWWIESMWSAPRELRGHESVRRRIAQGPPR